MKNHSQLFLNYIAQTKKRIKEISAQDLKNKIDQKQNLTIIDVREADEWLTGHIPGAIHLTKGIIERDIEKIIPDPNTPLLVYCAGGFRCALVADSLHQMGYQQVYSLDYGLQGWINEGYPIEI